MFKTKEEKEKINEKRQQLEEMKNDYLDKMEKYHKYHIEMTNEIKRLYEAGKITDTRIGRVSDEFPNIYLIINNLKDSYIIGAYIREMDYTLEDIKKIYNLSDNYIEETIKNWLPLIRQDAYKKLDEELRFRKDYPEETSRNHSMYYEITERIEYFYELRRNRTKLKREVIDKDLINKLKDNSEFSFLLNMFSVKDSLILAYGLNLIDIDKDGLNKYVSYDEEYFNQLLSVNRSNIINKLDERISKINDLGELNNSYFDYNELKSKYINMYNRIENTLNDLNNKKRF